MKKNLFRWLIALAFLLPCLVISASATEGYYTYSVSNGEATITGVDTSISGAVTIPSTLGGRPVTGIGRSAFAGCERLTSVTIPDSVTSIGSYAFLDCDGLTAVTIPDSVTSIGDAAFSDCESLTSVTIGSSVTSIGNSAFYNCRSLTSVTIGNSVTSIGDYAFDVCESLTQIKVAAGNTAYCDVDGVLFSKDKTQLVQCPGGRSGSYTIPDSVTSIGDHAFCDCTGLTSVTIPDSVTGIGDYAFAGCERLTSVTIGNSVTSIGNWAFCNCFSLTSVTIPDSVTSIRDSAFYGCSNLTIYGWAGSQVETYARVRGILFVGMHSPVHAVLKMVGETSAHLILYTEEDGAAAVAFYDDDGKMLAMRLIDAKQGLTVHTLTELKVASTARQYKVVFMDENWRPLGKAAVL